MPSIPIAPPTAAAEKTPAPPSAEPKGAAPIATTGTRAERLTAMTTAHDAAMNAFYQAFRDAKSDEERIEISKTAQPPDPAPYKKIALELIAEDPKDETAFQALSWLLGERPDKAEAAKCVELLERHHFESARMGDVLMTLQYSGPAGKALLARLAEKSPHRDVRGRALMGLAEAQKDDLATAESLAGMGDEDRKPYVEYLGEDECARLLALDREAAEKSVLALYGKVEREYADVESPRGGPIGAAAKNAVFEMENLVVGKTAPDIAGEDIEGVAFHLSDYRGKVVLLDFWGHW